jgi:hypothetical protein
MSNRLDKQKEEKLQPIRMNVAITKITELGYEIIDRTKVSLSFMFKGSKVTYFPYSGWASGKTITDGRGLENLINQIKK